LVSLVFLLSAPLALAYAAWKYFTL